MTLESVQHVGPSSKMVSPKLLVALDTSLANSKAASSSKHSIVRECIGGTPVLDVTSLAIL